MSQSKLSRRSLVGAATAVLATEAGVHLLASPFLPKTNFTNRLKRAVLDGDGRALASDAFAVAKNPIFILTVQAKWDSAGWLSRPNPLAVGIVGNPLVAPSTAFPSLNLTQMFGDYLLPLGDKVGLGIVPVSTTAGNHVYDGLRATMSKTGSLPYSVGETSGSLLALNFSSRGSADASTACFAADGTQLITYPSLDNAVSSMLDALTPLTKSLPTAAQGLLAMLNNRVTKDQTFRQGLEQLANRLQSAQAPLNAALELANTAPKMNGNFNQMNAAALSATNPLMPQIAAAAAVIDIGLIHAVTLSISNSDPNAGGNHDGRGGNNVAYGQLSPNEVKSCVGQAVAEIFRRYPTALVSINSDGGRSANGGDQQNFEGFIFGPASLINSTFVNASERSDSAQFGTTPPTATTAFRSTAK